MRKQDAQKTLKMETYHSGAPKYSPKEVGRLISILLAMLAAVTVLYGLWGGKNTKFENLALGRFTSSVYGTYKGEPIHCHDVSDADNCLLPAIKRSLPKAVLWLGNSQLHGINRVISGQQPASTLLARKWRPRGVEILAFSQPNASLREHYVMGISKN